MKVISIYKDAQWRTLCIYCDIVIVQDEYRKLPILADLRISDFQKGCKKQPGIEIHQTRQRNLVHITHIQPPIFSDTVIKDNGLVLLI